MKYSKSLLFFCSLCLILFSSCIREPSNSSNNSHIPPAYYIPSTRENDINPLIDTTASLSQDFIFSTDSVGFTTITIRRSEWNKMLTYYDYFYKNENNVYAESYEYEKDGKSWKLNVVGLRLRGNTSRFRPQGKDTTEDETNHGKPNAGWSEAYYTYAKDCPKDDYRQSHFKIDFEPFEGDDRKMSDCMKGVALKRTDSLFSKEIFCYNLFHQYGIWTAPRASQTKVYINFVEDINEDHTVKKDISGCSITQVDFGVYEMFEEVNKQSLKGRMAKKGNNTAETAWLNNDGDLWKCSGGDLTAHSNTPSNFGVEQIEILNADKAKKDWSFIWYAPCYDLKTNKKNLDSAALKFQGFLTELNNLSNINKFTDQGIQARKDFYEKWFDVDFFIKTYAVNILVGMDDDYWGNANNYYLYFDNGNGGSGKCYLIPFDYDNTLGASICDTCDRVFSNPFEWGNGKDRPLLDRLLEVPEYVEKMKNTLLEVSSQDKASPWNKNNCFNLWKKWHNQVRPYVYSKDIKGWPNIGTIGISDDGGWKAYKHYLTQDNDNIYEQVSLNYRFWLSNNSTELTFNLNGGSLNGQTDTVTAKYNGVNSQLTSIIDTPVRPGYEFVGWTRTKDGSDFTESYTGEDNFIVYASWIDVSNVSGLTIFEIKDTSYNGIKLFITNLPENHYRRTFYINGKEVGGDEMGKKYGKIWAYPFTEPGKTYNVYVSYANQDYGWLANSNTLSIKAESGLGEFKVINTPDYYIKNNILKWNSEPLIQVGNNNPIREDDNWNEYYLLEVQSTKKKDPAVQSGIRDSWNYQSWNWLGASCNKGFNFKEHVTDEVLSGLRSDLCFRIKYNYNNSPYGDLCLIVLDYGDTKRFNIE
ncbi:MAG: CotH kinase family protein [Treponema sp.]|nr:CotH kinase family protein [Treponema sp.]